MALTVLLQSEQATCWQLQLKSPEFTNRQMMLNLDGIHDQQTNSDTESETVSQPLDLSKAQTPIKSNVAGGSNKNEIQQESMAARKKTRLLRRKMRKGKPKNKANHSGVQVDDALRKMNTRYKQVRKMARKSQRTLARYQFWMKLLQSHLCQQSKLNQLQVNQICDLREELRTSWSMMNRAFLQIHALQNSVADLDAMVFGNEFDTE